jgi:acetylornithine and succinylornithine aminotransferases
MAVSQLEAIRQEEESLLFRTYARYPLALDRGKGCRVWDYDGKEYLDLLAGIAVNGLGHSHPEIAETIASQAKKLIHVSNLFYQKEQLDLARRILATAHFDKVFFCNSGAEANEAAIKLARRYQQRVKNTQAFEVITFDHCFHGRTLATVAATGQQRFQDGFGPMPEGFLQIEFGDPALLERSITPKTAAVLIEVLQGEGGVRPVTREFVIAVQDICRKNGVLLMVDEVQCGMGRTGKWWGFQHFSIQPDVLTTAKSLANGLPMGAMMATDEIAKGFVTGSHATTFGAGALVSSAAAKVFEIIERDNLLAHAASLGEWAKKRFLAIGEKLPGTIREVRGIGLMIGIDLAFPGKEVWNALIDRGFILNLTQDTVLRLLPPLIVTQEELETFACALEEILAARK